MRACLTAVLLLAAAMPLFAGCSAEAPNASGASPLAWPAGSLPPASKAGPLAAVVIGSISGDDFSGDYPPDPSGPFSCDGSGILAVFRRSAPTAAVSITSRPRSSSVVGPGRYDETSIDLDFDFGAPATHAVLSGDPPFGHGVFEVGEQQLAATGAIQLVGHFSELGADAPVPVDLWLSMAGRCE